MASLFDKKGASWNPFVIQQKDAISARITSKQIELLRERQLNPGLVGARPQIMLEMLSSMLIKLNKNPDSQKLGKFNGLLEGINTSPVNSPEGKLPKAGASPAIRNKKVVLQKSNLKNVNHS